MVSYVLSQLPRHATVMPRAWPSSISTLARRAPPTTNKEMTARMGPRLDPVKNVDDCGHAGGDDAGGLIDGGAIELVLYQVVGIFM